jgi:Putative F0F1-ATPase subunit Ca2+/Mg2+ transporter
MNLPNKPINKKKFDQFIRYSSLGFEMAAIIGVGTFAGYQLDKWLHNEFRICTLVLMVFSAIGSIFYTIRNLLKK